MKLSSAFLKFRRHKKEITEPKPVKENIDKPILPETEQKIILSQGPLLPLSKIVKELPKEPPFLFDQRVMRWHEHPINQALKLDLFEEEYVNSSRAYQRLMIDYHSFSGLADRFYDIGIKQARKNPDNGCYDMQYFVAAEIKRGNEAVKRGVIIWVVDEKDNRCYHKFFHERETRVVIKAMMDHAFLQADFPLLKFAKMGKVYKAESLKVNDEKIEIDPIFGHISIFNHRLNLKVTLYRSSLYLPEDF